MQTVQLEYNHITGSQYILKPTNVPYTVVSYKKNNKPSKPSKHMSKPILHNNSHSYTKNKKNQRDTLLPVLNIHIDYVEYILISEDIFSKQERKVFNKRLTLQRKQQRANKQLLQTLSVSEPEPIIPIEITPHICEIVTDFINHKVQIPFLVCKATQESTKE